MDYMRQALALARLAQGQVSPNPAVGALIVKDGEIVGQGYTQPPGSSHAEIVALHQAGEKSAGRLNVRHPRTVLPLRPHPALHRSDH